MELNNYSNIVNNIKLLGDDWQSLQKDFYDHETKSIICAKYGLKGFQYKALKKYFLGDSNE